MYKELTSFIGEELSYKKITEITGIKYYTGGKSKSLQIEDIKRYYKLEKNGSKYLIVERYDNPIEKADGRMIGNNTKYYWLNYNKKYEGKGLYYILDEFNNIYIGSTNVSFKNRYRCHISNNNVCESSKVVCNNHIYDILYDMSNIEDEELIRMCEYKAIDWFRENTDYNVVNVKEEFTKPKKQKYKNIKIKEELYSKAVELLLENEIEIENNLI